MSKQERETASLAANNAARIQDLLGQEAGTLSLVRDHRALSAIVIPVKLFDCALEMGSAEDVMRG